MRFRCKQLLNEAACCGKSESPKSIDNIFLVRMRSATLTSAYYICAIMAENSQVAILAHSEIL